MKKNCCPHCGGALYDQDDNSHISKPLTCIWCGQPVVEDEDIFAEPDSDDFELPEVKNLGETLETFGDTIKNSNAKRYVTSHGRDWGLFFLCLFLGVFGIHKFVEGKTGMGVLYLFTIGLFYIGWIVDIFRYLKRAIGF